MRWCRPSAPHPSWQRPSGTRGCVPIMRSGLTTDSHRTRATPLPNISRRSIATAPAHCIGARSCLSRKSLRSSGPHSPRKSSWRRRRKSCRPRTHRLQSRPSSCWSLNDHPRMTQFVHLRVHTEYSLLDSVVRVPELMAATAAAGMPAIALTDESNLFAMVKFYRAAQSRGVKPVIGVDLRLRESIERQEPARLTLLSQNLGGYRNLTRLMTRACLEGQRRGVPLVDRAWLTPASTTGLIALSGAQDGDIGRALLNNRPDDARRYLEQWRELFAQRFYVEIQRLGRANEEDYLDAVLDLVATCPTPIVATNDVRFITAQDFESHEARVCIQEGSQLGDPARARRYSELQYLRSPAEMAELFADLP